jgi:uncharacterized protein YbaP (TraB family)
MHMLLRRIGAFLAAILSCLSVSASAQQPVQPRPSLETVKPANTARPALWKVSDEDTTIYLFGTIHALPDGIDWFGGPLEQAFDSSQELVTEIVEPDPSHMQALVLNSAILPAGQSLRGLLSPGERASYDSALKTLGMQPGDLDRTEFWFAALNIVNRSLALEGYGQSNGVESALNARAKALGRPHTALETAEFQLGLFDALPVDTQKRYLAEVVDHLPEVKTQLDDMIGAWKRGDADELAKVLNADEDDPAMIETLLLGRNRTWAGWIKDRMARPGTVFLAVGAGHLAGPGSVQDQLAAHGITSQRVQ